MYRFLAGLILVVCLNGCSDSSSEKSSPETSLAKPRTTDAIGEFDAASGSELVDDDVEISNPITGPLEAFGPIKQKISGMAITQAVEMFRATEGRYPRDYDEFMSRVIKANQIRLPEPGNGLAYQYDVENHCLVVVKKSE